jgi:hypothetical protein
MSTPIDSTQNTFSTNLNRQIGLYSLAAAVAGVSMLAIAEPAQGEVVVTKKSIPVPISPWPTPEPVRISIANNGVDNFSLWRYSLSDHRGLLVWGASPQDGVITASGFYGRASALARGAKIGASASFFNNYTDLIEATAAFTSGRYSRGLWGGNPKDRYLGIRFSINGQFHYGWIRLSVTSNVQLNKQTLSATITGYAYETVPNKAILAGTAGKPTAETHVPENTQSQSGPSLGMLAAGAEGMPLWRRE